MKERNKSSKVLVLGANSGIGLAFVKHFIGSKGVIAISRSTNNLEEINSDNLQIIKADLTKRLPDIDGDIDTIINCIGIASFKPFKKVNIRDIDRIIDVNVKTPILTTQKYIQDVVKSTSSDKTLIQICSLAGLKPDHKDFSLYSATKMSLLGLYNSLSAEYKDENIRFILVAPHAYKSNISKDSIGGNELQALLDSVDLISAEDMVTKILSEIKRHEGNLLPLIIED